MKFCAAINKIKYLINKLGGWFESSDEYIDENLMRGRTNYIRLVGSGPVALPSDTFRLQFIETPLAFRVVYMSQD